MILLNHVGLAGLHQHIQAAFPATSHHLQKARLLWGGKHSLGGDLLHILPVKDDGLNIKHPESITVLPLSNCLTHAPGRAGHDVV